MDIFLSVVGVIALIVVAIVVFVILVALLPTILTIAILETLAIFGGGYFCIYVCSQYVIPNTTTDLQRIGAYTIGFIVYMVLEAGVMCTMLYVADFSHWAKTKMFSK